MHHTCMVCRRQRCNHLPNQGQRLLIRHRSMLAQMNRQGLAGQQFHRQEQHFAVRFIPVTAEIEYSAYVGMTDSSGELNLLFEPI